VNNRIGDLARIIAELRGERIADQSNIAQLQARRFFQRVPKRLFREVDADSGYVNFKLKRSPATAEVLETVIESGENYGRQQIGVGQTIVLDYSSPNIAKPFHLGHLRSTNIGADLARIFEFLGYDVWRRNYLGDWGTQFGFVIYGWKKYGSEDALESDSIQHLVDLYIRANQEAERDPSVRDRAREYFRRLEEGDPKLHSLWERFRRLSVEAFEKTYDRLDIQFDSYEGEAAAQQRVDETIERFLDAGVAEISDGATIVEVSDTIEGEHEIAPCMLRKSDGSTTYAARDVAEAIRRWEETSFAYNIYVVGRQEDHFRQVFGALHRLAEAEGWDDNWSDRCENVSFGFVRGMSTREGNAIWLEDVLDEAKDRARASRIEKQEEHPDMYPPLNEEELDRVSEAVGQAALLYSDVSARRMRDIQFDWDEVLKFEGRTGPYLQYTHARMEGVWREAEEVDVGDLTDVNARRISSDQEWALVRHLDKFSETVRRAGEEREPSVVATYLFDLASLFNSFYGAHRVINPDDAELTRARLALVRVAQIVLRNGLHLLRIQPLDVM
jgi:arginyl-tRNA synthetase